MSDVKIKIFCGKKMDKKSFLSLKQNNVELIKKEECFEECHLIFSPSQEEKEKAQRLGIPFYIPRNQISRRIRFYFKQILREFLDDILSIRLRPPLNSKEVLILRTDAIGDYLLFRNFLEPLYKKYGALNLVVNEGCQEIVEKCDRKYLNKIYYFNRKKFSHNLLYRMRFLRKLRRQCFEVLIHPTYGRDYCAEDIARSVIAKEKIAPVGNISNVLDFHKKRFDKNYTQLLPNDKRVIFEFDRNFEFISQLCELKEMDLSIHLPQEDISCFGLDSKYVVFFLGASTECRKWGSENLISLAQRLESEYLIVLCGGGEDWQSGERIVSNIRRGINLCGKTSLIELGLVLEGSEFVLSNETSCVHLYMGLKKKKKIYVLSAGNTIVRFVPYPQAYESYYEAIFHPFIEKYFSEFLWISENITHSGGGLDIKTIASKRVLESIEKTLKLYE